MTSNCGLVICRPVHWLRSNVPYTTIRVRGLIWSFKYVELNHDSRTVPDSSRSNASKIRTPGRRVPRSPAVMISPAIETVWPSRSDAIVCRRLRSS
jgi:hypothetical protein